MISDELLAVGHDDDVVVIDGTSRHTYRDLRAAVSGLVRTLLDTGAAPGQRIGILGANSFSWIVGYLAAMRVGVAVPLSEKATPEELRAQMDWVDCTLVLADRVSRRRFADALEGRVVLTEPALPVMRSAASEVVPPMLTDPGRDVTLMFTSGTTARPKAVRLTDANLSANTTSIVELLGLRRSDRMLVVLPFHYVFGASLLHTHLAVGASLVLCNTFTYPETAVEMIERHACSGFAGVPSSYQLLLKASTFGSRTLPTLRQLQQAGGRLAPELLRTLAAAQPHAEVFVMYGQTEATARLSYLPPELLGTRGDSIGRGIPGVQLSVRDDAGAVVPPGSQGEIWARGANISPGYWNDPEATAAKFVDGWLRTGDLATWDDQGFVSIVGRSGDFIKSWGHRIAPQQVEEAALSHAMVAGSAAVGVPDAAAGEAIVLAVSLVPGAELSADDLLRFLRDVLPRHAVPTEVRVWETIPTTASGKVNRNDVKTLLRGPGAA